MRNIYVLIFWVALAISACKKPLSDKPVVLVSPSELVRNANGGDFLTYTINVKSEIALNRFTITEKINNGASKKILDTILSTKNFNLTYEYPVPNVNENSIIVLNLSATDVDGNTGTDLKRVDVTSVAKALVEKSGNIFYSANNTGKSKPDGQNLLTVEPTFSNTTNSALRHIEDYPLSDTLESLSRRWVSPAGCKFVKFNSFDYPNATTSTAESAYISGTKLSIISAIDVGDIYITKVMDGLEPVYVVIKLVSISDAAGTDNDIYTFNIKK